MTRRAIQKIAIVTDAWRPQVNGVVRTLEAVISQLRGLGHEVLVISPDAFPSIACPTYPEIRLAFGGRKVGQVLDAFQPDAIHLSTEGPLGYLAKRWCQRNGHAFSTAYHTQFPQYVARRTGLSPRLFWPIMRTFHKGAANVLVSTNSIARDLSAQGIGPTVKWGRGVDLEQFRPDVAPTPLFASLPKPILLYVGRVAVEKNIDAFLRCKHAGSKVVVGNGPALKQLAQKYPDAHFLGSMTGRDLASCYAGADVFVFPSLTDTFGLVNIEALACGTPVAAFPVAGPIDILTPETGAMADNLDDAIGAALTLRREDCARYARQFSWRASAQEFLQGLVRIDWRLQPAVRPMSSPPIWGAPQ